MEGMKSEAIMWEIISNTYLWTYVHVFNLEITSIKPKEEEKTLEENIGEETLSNPSERTILNCHSTDEKGCTDWLAIREMQKEDVMR